MEVFSQLIQDYRAYKSKFAQNLKFNSSSPTLGGYTSNFIHINMYSYFCAASPDDEDIYFVEIFFDTSTYDEVQQDKKMTLEAQIGLIGGTMGLLTGFSILSGVEIIYHAIRFFASLKMRQG